MGCETSTFIESSVPLSSSNFSKDRTESANINYRINLQKTSNNGDISTNNYQKCCKNSTTCNDFKLKKQDDVLYSNLLLLLKNEEFESGVVNNSEELFISYMRNNQNLSLMTLNAIFLKNIDNPHVISGILHILSHLDYSVVYPIGQNIAMISLNLKSSMVNEYAIKCFDNWENKESIMLLENLSYSNKWLDEYVSLVIKDLRRL